MYDWMFLNFFLFDSNGLLRFVVVKKDREAVRGKTISKQYPGNYKKSIGDQMTIKESLHLGSIKRTDE